MGFYKRIVWGKERVTASKLNDMVANDDYLYETMFKGNYNVLGVARETGLTFRAGYVDIPGSDNQLHYVRYYYPKPFLPGSRPVVVASIATDWKCMFWIGVRGLDGRGVPDHRGFELILPSMPPPGVKTEFMGDLNVAFIAIAPSSA